MALVNNHNETLLPAQRGLIAANHNETLLAAERGFIIGNHNETLLPGTRGGRLINHNETLLPAARGVIRATTTRRCSSPNEAGSGRITTSPCSRARRRFGGFNHNETLLAATQV